MSDDRWTQDIRNVRSAVGRAVSEFAHAIDMEREELVTSAYVRMKRTQLDDTVTRLVDIAVEEGRRLEKRSGRKRRVIEHGPASPKRVDPEE